MDQDNEENKTVCIVCQKEFKRRSALYRHLRGVHKLTIEFTNRKYKFKCPDPSCSSVTFHLANLLRNHIKDVHGVPIQMCFKKFNTYDEFKKWKDAVQDKTKSLYTSCQNKRGDKYRHFLYTCYRSGGFVPSKASGKRRITPKKIDGWCPSGMEVKVFYAGGVQVKYWMTHFGHECEVDRLNLSRREKLIIARKLKEGLSFEKILDDIRESVVDGEIKRIHLLSRTDISNISKAFKINKKDNLMKEEAPNISAWVQSMEALGEDSPVLFFKEKGAEHHVLKLNDYMLIVMTKVQQKLLEMCTHHIICIDDIRICQSYNYHLIILMTIDDSDIACPLAFGVANKVDDTIVGLMLEILSSKASPISTNIFMSSDIPALFSTWQKHMNPASAHLLCTWQVDKDWRKSLEKLPCSEEKKSRVYKNLKQLMLETDFKTFRSRIEDTLQQFDTDSDFKRFGIIFKTKYVERCELWAYCYRSEQLLFYSAILEQLHKDLIECYEEGRVANSFVKTLNLIIGHSRDKMLAKLQKLPRELQIGNVGNICQTHQEIQEIDVIKAQNVSEKHLQGPTIEKDCCYVEHNIHKVCPPDCVPICAFCSICFHKFTCTCIENFFNLNICRHIFASVNMMKNQCKHSKEHENGKRNLESTGDVFIDGDITVTREEIVESTKENFISADVEEESESMMSDNILAADNENSTNFDEEQFALEDCIDIVRDNEFAEEQDMEDSEEEFFDENCEDEFMDENSGEFADENSEEFAEENSEEFAEENSQEFAEENCKEFNQENSTELVGKECSKPTLVRLKDVTKESDKENVEDEHCGNVEDEHCGNVEDEHCGKDNSHIDSPQISLQQKTAYIHDVISNRTLRPEVYEIVNDYVDKILEILNSDNQ